MDNIITANLALGRKISLQEVFQYNRGQKQMFTGVPLPHVYTVDFSNSIYGESKKMIGDDTGVTIPDEYFIPGQTIFAWVVISGEDSRETVYEVRIPISLRARPIDETPTPQQQSIIDQLVAEMDTAVDSAEGYAAEAEAAKEAIENMGVASETLSPGSDATVEKEIDQETGIMTLRFGIPKGDVGQEGAVFLPSVSEAGVISWTNNGGLPNPEEKNIKGRQGDPGVSPEITISDIENGHRLTIVDAEHPNGQNVDILDGVSPDASVRQTSTGATIEIEDYKHGVTSAIIYNGANGRGIASAVLNADYTLTLTYTDGTSYTTPSIRGADGKGIVSIVKTSTSGLVDTYTITYTSGDPTTFLVTNGADGAPGTPGTDGTNAYVWIRYASAQPTQDSDMSTTPGPWMGICSGASDTAPTDYTAYTWYRIKGDTGPVQDVQVSGTSILSNGVANVPLANTNGTPGAVKIVVGNGIGLSGQGNLAIVPAISAAIKNGTNGSTPIVPKLQHESVFYGIAKAAGADMASSSNPVGTYTDAAKVAIQKMLGIYEAPWELIREDTVTNATEADIEITVDGNGQAFELTDVYIEFWLPEQENQARKGNYGKIECSDGVKNPLTFYGGAWTQDAGAASKIITGLIQQRDGVLITTYTKNAGNGADVSIYGNVRNSGTVSRYFTFDPNGRIFNSIKISAVTGTGCYKLYGKRKWS